MSSPKVFVCIPVYNRLTYTIGCIDSIKAQTYTNIEIIVCDDASTDGTEDYLKINFPSVHILKGNGNLWWTGATNKCIEYALEIGGDYDFILTLNNDAFLEKNCVETLVNQALTDDRVIISCGNYFMSKNGQLEATAFIKGSKSLFFKKKLKLLYKWGEYEHNIKNRINLVYSVSGKGVLIPFRVFKEIGLYDFEHFPHYHSDTEFTRRASDNGYRIYQNLDAITYTFEEETSVGGQASPKISFKQFYNSFFTIKSGNHIGTLKSISKNVYPKIWFLYFVYMIIGIVWGYLKGIIGISQDKRFITVVSFGLIKSSNNH